MSSLSSPFPLLRLPRLVLFEVFKTLNIREKIKLSFCSKKISTQINSARLYSQKVIVDLDILNQNIEVHSENNKDTFEILICPDFGISHNSNIQQFSISFCPVKVISIPTGIKTFWQNHREGFLFVIRHLWKMFQCKITTDIEYYNCDLYQSTISELFDEQLQFERLSIELKGSKDEHLLWNQISSNFGRVEYLRIFSVVNPDFTPVFTSWPQQIYIRSSYWFTLEYLLECTCTTITLEESHLGNKDMDMLLKKWKTGGFPTLKCLTIFSQNIKIFGTTILGMNLRELDGMVIQTDDGSKKAIIRSRSKCIVMSVNSSE